MVSNCRKPLGLLVLRIHTNTGRMPRTSFVLASLVLDRFGVRVLDGFSRTLAQSSPLCEPRENTFAAKPLHSVDFVNRPILQVAHDLPRNRPTSTVAWRPS